VPSNVRDAVELFPKGEKAEVCGTLDATGEEITYIHSRRSDYRQLAQAYYDALEEAGFERKMTDAEEESEALSSSWSGPRLYARDKHMVEIELMRAGDTFKAMLRDRSDVLKEEKKRREQRIARREERRKFVEPLSEWVDAVRPAVDDLTGTKACEPDLVPEDRPPLIELKSLETLLARDGDYRAPCSELPRWGAPGAQPEAYLTNEEGKACREMLRGERPVSLLVENSVEWPSLPRSVDGRKEAFVAGSFRGRIVVWSPDKSEALCHVPVSAQSSEKVEFTKRMQNDRVVFDTAASEVSADFRKNVGLKVMTSYEQIYSRNPAARRGTSD
jgi:hypothetical protein